MKKTVTVLLLLALASTAANAETAWYSGDERCQPPQDKNAFSAPYNPLDHPNDYPTFPDANKSGWSCSYQRDDGTIVQYGDSRTPQEQWLSVWERNDDSN